MKNQTKLRLEALAEFIESTQLVLSPVAWHLAFRGYPGYGYSVLGLVCAAHEHLTGNGRWIYSNPAVKELPDYESEREITDMYLPRSVIDYFGLRDKVGSFGVGELPQDVKRLMYRTTKTERSSLLAIGGMYPKRAREIVVKVIRAMPPSFIKTEPSKPLPTTPPMRFIGLQVDGPQ